MNQLTCILCGQTDYHVKVSLIEWANPIEEQRFSAVARCQDREACRSRVEARGEEWEVAA